MVMISKVGSTHREMAVPVMDTDVSVSNISSSDDVAPSQANATWIALRASAGDTEKPLSLRALLCLKEHMNATSFLKTPLLLPITERNVCFIKCHCPTHSQWRRLTHQPIRNEYNLIKRKLEAEIPPHINWCCSRDSVFQGLISLKKKVVGPKFVDFSFPSLLDKTLLCWYSLTANYHTNSLTD